MYKRIIALFLVLVTLIPAGFVVSASAADYQSTANSLWEYYLHSIVKAWDDYSPLRFINAQFGFASSKTVCSLSDDSFHHADSIKGAETGSDKYGQYAVAKCRYCGENFNYYSSDLSDAYTSYVSDLPATAVSSEGYLYWVPDIEVGWAYSYNAYYYFYDSTSTHANANFQTIDFSVLSVYNPTHLTLTYNRSGNAFSGYVHIYYDISDVCPVAGYYSVYSSARYSGYYLDAKAKRYDLAYSTDAYPSTGTYYAGGNSFKQRVTYSGAANFVFADITAPAPVVRIKPLSGLIDTTTDTTYNVDSRVGSISGDYGIIGDNGQITKVDSKTIVNETNKTVYNPVTNTTTNITDWTYDYSDRSYTVTTDNSTTQTITYGNEYVTIKEGDTVYNIYYITNSSGTETPDPGATDTPTTCDHDYVSTVITAATCEMAGEQKLTCSKCGASYTEKIPATGHTWTVKQTVNTEYDDTGNVVTKGYTIYKCSVCGTEYKDESGSGPPNSKPSGGSSGSSSGLFSGIFGILWDFCSFFFDFFKDFVVGGVSGFLSALRDGSSGFFDILNPLNWFV